jgi:hypothetical protein
MVILVKVMKEFFYLKGLRLSKINEFNKFFVKKKFLNEPLQWTMIGSIRRRVALEGNSKF